jgi:hypothetical protein
MFPRGNIEVEGTLPDPAVKLTIADDADVIKPSA